jgi:hypothetical protein
VIASATAIVRNIVMTNLLKFPYSVSRVRRSTIGQERDLFVGREWEAETTHRNDGDLRLLADALMGLQGISKSRQRWRRLVDG